MKHWEIDEVFEYFGNNNNKINLCLNPNKSIDPFIYLYPITWTGLIGSQKIEIIQIDAELNFEFSNFPIEYNSYKNLIETSIEKYIDEKCK